MSYTEPEFTNQPIHYPDLQEWVDKGIPESILAILQERLVDQGFTPDPSKLSDEAFLEKLRNTDPIDCQQVDLRVAQLKTTTLRIFPGMALETRLDNDQTLNQRVREILNRGL